MKVTGFIVGKTTENYEAKNGDMAKAYYIWLQSESPMYGAGCVVVPQPYWEQATIGEEVTLPGFIGSFRRFVYRDYEALREEIGQ